MKTSEKLKIKLQELGQRFYAGDNISNVLEDGDKQKLIDELVPAFEAVLQGLVIDVDNDPNSKDTPRRLAKMYINEIMSGRYLDMPNPNSFPNYVEGGYEGMLVVRSELKSMCSHHHQPVAGIAYIGLIAGDKLLGLSKYTRIAQWCSRRGTLQEELNVMIANEIQRQCETEHVGVYIKAKNGCWDNRGKMAHSCLKQTTVLRGGVNERDQKKEM